MSTTRTKRKWKVLLNVYDLMEANNYGYSLGFGAYHSGVEVDGKEYTFGGNSADVSGIFVVEPKRAAGVLKFRETIDMGETLYTPDEVRSVVDSMSDQYLASSYHVLKKNCNHFADDLCMKLVEKNIPGWVNRLASYGSLFACFMPPNLSATAPTPTVQPSQKFVPFQGTGNTISSNSSQSSSTTTSTSVSEEELKKRRERYVAAALQRAAHTGNQ